MAIGGYRMRKPHDDLLTIEIKAGSALHIPEALRHVANETFESDEEDRYYLRDAVAAFEEALRQAGETVNVQLTHREIDAVAPAISHVMREVFDGDSPEHSLTRYLLRQAQEKLEAAVEPYVSASGPRR